MPAVSGKQGGALWRPRGVTGKRQGLQLARQSLLMLLWFVADIYDQGKSEVGEVSGSKHVAPPSGFTGLTFDSDV